LFLESGHSSGHVPRQLWWKAILADQVTRPTAPEENTTGAICISLAFGSR
jgi:hypothetical protein